ncbi:threonine-phosphate decarboxylase CobD [Tropicimonas sp. IMCC34043]|uniref:threonine-phosphate decarboxylase CobD n=1 Tax=Tropicimonas sp. IMCC34043 TaxID=2248760 RepID=UPI000E260CB4|nr:threonine-phosphate decarboxylase CobD [Tropicimonas sp. IMCC34043]
MAKQTCPSGNGRDHGGGVDAAAARWGGARDEWLDLSTGINPCPWPVPDLPHDAWTALPDRAAGAALIAAARDFWQVPESLQILPVPGASAAIARIPALAAAGRVRIPAPTYNEHAAGFRAGGWELTESTDAEATVLVHPNNPDGRLWRSADLPRSGLLILDESFCDTCPEASLLRAAADRPDTLVLKSFGKFWGLAGLRLGFVIGAPERIAPLAEMIGPWAVSGPALAIGAAALADFGWAAATRTRLNRDAEELDATMTAAGARAIGGTTLFRLYDVGDAAAWQARLADARIWTRTFPYCAEWLRLGLPGDDAGRARLTAALA